MLPNIRKISLNFPDAELQQLITVISNVGGKVRLIGGSVRDALLSKAISDYDLATDLQPEQVIKIATDAGYKAIPTGIEFGTVTIVINKKPFEVTTLRSDIECFGRKATVRFTNDFRIDAERRDFTINALSYDINLEELYDYFEGYQDLQVGVVKFIGIAEQRITEDYLRIMRFFRFSAYYGISFNTEGLTACKKLAHNLNSITIERIYQEFIKILKAPIQPLIQSLQAMEESGVWSVICPHLSLNYHYLNKVTVTSNELTKFALLLISNDIQVCLNWLKAAKFSNNEQKTIGLYLEFAKTLLETNNSVEFQLNKNWYIRAEWMDNYLIIALALEKINEEKFKYYQQKYSTFPPIFPVVSNELMEQGLIGEKLGLTLKSLKEEWIKSDFQLNKDQLLNFIQK